MRTQAPSARLLDKLASSKLALVMVLLLIAFSIVGAVLPQEGQVETKDITLWQMDHPVVTRLLQPFGFFRVFNSWAFIVVILILGVNTLTCTLLRFVKEGGFSSLRGPGAVRRMGFLLLHLSLILLFAGGFVSAGTKLTARIVLTEGQTFEDRHDNYLQIVEGPLRPERHTGAVVHLKKVRIKYEQKRYPVDVATDLEFQSGPDSRVPAEVKINYPVSYKNLAFTQDQTGFSPRLVIWEIRSKQLLFNSFIALKTIETPEGNLYRDFLSLPFLKQTFMVTVLPSYVLKGGKARKTGENPENPLLLIERLDSDGKATAQWKLPLRGRITIGEHLFLFTELRHWSGFMIVDDPGYLPVSVALWLGVGAMILRYVPDLRRWFAKDPTRAVT